MKSLLTQTIYARAEVYLSSASAVSMQFPIGDSMLSLKSVHIGKDQLLELIGVGWSEEGLEAAINSIDVTLLSRKPIVRLDLTSGKLGRQVYAEAERLSCLLRQYEINPTTEHAYK